MNDILLTAKRQKQEMKWFAACFCAAILINVFAIIIYKTLWSELFTQFLWVILITCFLYAVSVGIRIAFYLIKRLFGK